MLTNDFLEDEVARLGFGAMRLPVVDGDASHVDQAQVDAMVDAALASGVNYFDTAYPYHGGHSEIALGRSLARHPRESYFLASKYPGHQIAESYDPAAVFEEQLEKCGVDHFDFYLLHNVYEASIDVYTDEKWGIADYFVEQKKAGHIWDSRAMGVPTCWPTSSTTGHASTRSSQNATPKLPPCSRAATSWSSARSR